MYVNVFLCVCAVRVARGIADIMDPDLPDYQFELLDFYDKQVHHGYELGPRSLHNMTLLLIWASKHRRCPTLPQLLRVLGEVLPDKIDVFTAILRSVSTSN